MKRFETRKGCLVFMFILSVFLIAGCGGSGGGGGLTTINPVSFTVPVDGTIGVPVGNRLTVTFNEEMNEATITEETFTLAQGATPVSGIVDYSGVTAVFTPDVDLEYSTTYTATITTGAKNLAGNALESDYVWTFTTGVAPDTTAPTVTLTDPADGATGVAINKKMSATFSEPMDPLTITTAAFTVTGPGVTPVAGTVTYSGVTAVFTPDDALEYSTTYTATITTGAEDLAVAGNPLASDYVWTFTTGVAPDTTAPTVTLTDPADGDTDVATNKKIAATFNEAMDPLTISTAAFKVTGPGVTPVAGTVIYVGNIATFTPTGGLAGNTTFTATITTGAEDLAGNPLASDYEWTFTTGDAPDITPPTVSATNPADFDIDVCVNKTINATFDEAMDPLTITNITFTLEETIGGAPVTGVVLYDPLTNIATFNPTADLADNTSYTATIKGGASGDRAMDLAGNALADDNVTNFDTGTTTCTPPVDLGAAQPLGGIAGGGAGMTNQGTLTVINGDISTTAVSTTVTGFHDSTGDGYTETLSNIGTVNGRIYTAPPPPVIFGPGGPFGGTSETEDIATAAADDALIAYDSISPAALPGGANVGNNLGGLTLAPGIYLAPAPGGTFLLTGSDLTLDGQGDPNAVWVFQAPASLTIGAPGSPRSIILINGAQAKNVSWWVGSAARIENLCHMVGTIIASAGVTISTAGELGVTTLDGRAIGLHASVTVVNTVINVPAP